MKGKITAVLFILVFLLVVAVVFTFLTSLDRRREAAANEPVNNDVVVTENTPVPTAEPAAAPAEPAEPAAAVIETPTPEGIPESVSGNAPDMGALLGSGSFSSNTGTAVNIRADWEARVSGANEVKLQVKIILNSYSIYVNSLPNAVNIGLNGQYVSLDSPALSYDSNTSQLTAELASQSFTVQLPAGSSRDLDLQAEWHWGGTYGGVYIPVIECGGTISLSR